MKKTTIALCLSTLFTLVACSPAEDTKAAPPATTSSTNTESSDTKIFATVNGTPIPSTDVETLIEMNQSAGQANIEQIAENVILQEVLVQEARRLGIDQSSKYKVQSNFINKALLTNMLFENFVQNHPVTDAEIEKEYSELKEQLIQAQEAEKKQFLARHILVESEDEAKQLIQQLQNGADFSELAKNHSKDPGSAQTGGSLGDWNSASIFVPEFANALSSMKKGDISSTPVQTQFGWHIISVEDTREVAADAGANVPELDEHIKAQLREQLNMQKFLDYQNKLLQDADIVRK